MADLGKLKLPDGTDFMPYTQEELVMMADGTTLSAKLDDLDDEIALCNNKITMQRITTISDLNDHSVDFTSYKLLFVVGGTPYYKFTWTIPTEYLTTTKVLFASGFNSLHHVIRFGMATNSIQAYEYTQNGSTSNGSISVYGLKLN